FRISSLESPYFSPKSRSLLTISIDFTNDFLSSSIARQYSGGRFDGFGPGACNIQTTPSECTATYTYVQSASLFPLFSPSTTPYFAIVLTSSGQSDLLTNLPIDIISRISPLADCSPITCECMGEYKRDEDVCHSLTGLSCEGFHYHQQLKLMLCALVVV